MSVSHIVSVGHLCVPTELMKTNHARVESFPFDWCRSNIAAVTEVIEKGHSWHMKHNIEEGGKVYPGFHFPSIRYMHHDYKKQVNYFERCSRRLEKLLDKDSEDFVVFLYMGNLGYGLSKEEIDKFIQVVRTRNPSLNFHLVVALYVGRGRSADKVMSGEYYTLYHCRAPKQFYSNPMRGHPFYKKLFKEIIPWPLAIKPV